jgi:hypothetical protein
MDETMTVSKQRQWLITEYRCKRSAPFDRRTRTGNVPEAFEHSVLWPQPPSGLEHFFEPSTDAGED